MRPGAVEAARLGEREPRRPKPGTLSFGGWEVTDWGCGHRCLLKVPSNRMGVAAEFLKYESLRSEPWQPQGCIYFSMISRLKGNNSVRIIPSTIFLTFYYLRLEIIFLIIMAMYVSSQN